MRIMRTAISAGLLDDCSTSSNGYREQWQFYVNLAIRGAMSLVAENNPCEWCTRTHMAGLELVAELLSKLSMAGAVIGETWCEAFEDALTGVAYAQLVDEESSWSPWSLAFTSCYSAGLD